MRAPPHAARAPSSRGVAGLLGSTLVVNLLPGSLGGCRDGYAVLRPAPRTASSSPGPGTARHRTDRHERTRRFAPTPLRATRSLRAHHLRAAVRVRGCVAVRRRLAGLGDDGVGDGGDGRRTHARDEPEPPRGRRARRPESAHRDAELPAGTRTRCRCGCSAPRRWRRISWPCSNSTRPSVGRGRSPWPSSPSTRTSSGSRGSATSGLARVSVSRRRGLARGDGIRAVGSVGVGARGGRGWRASTTRCSISSTIGSKGSTRGRRGSGRSECFGALAPCT